MALQLVVQAVQEVAHQAQGLAAKEMQAGQAQLI
jgi:hypothetical protein